jgi:hypothetical protein
MEISIGRDCGSRTISCASSALSPGASAQAIETAADRRHPLDGAAVLVSWDEELTSTMREKQIAIAEEAVAHLLMPDLDGS